MPGGICAAASPTDFKAAARCSILEIRAFGLKRTIHLGGFAEAYFPDFEQGELQTLRSSDTVKVVWENAVFRGHDILLGDITARLNRDAQLKLNASLITSSALAASDGFFPASNRNFLAFEIEIPRFGLKLASEMPITNSATIDQIPPFNAIYKLERVTRFRPTGNSALKELIHADVEKCNVKLNELKNIKLTLKEISRTSTHANYSATLLNETTEENIEIAWMLWPDHKSLANIYGFTHLDRESQTIEFSVPLGAMTETIWFAIAISKPFHTDGAAIERLP